MSVATTAVEGLDAPLFVIGPARSGTTLTYSLLLASGQFPVYEAESRILECASRYGPLGSVRNRRAFLADFLRSRQFSRSGLSEDQVVSLAAQRSTSYVDFLDGFMGAISRAQGKQRWVEKSPNNVNFVRELAGYYPEARFLHVVRDGRSVVVSQRKHGGRKYSRDPHRQLIWIANVWDTQVAAGQTASSLGDRYLEIRYEDIVTDFDATLAKIGQFAGVELDRAMVEASSVGALGGANTSFQMEGGGTISTSALKRWRSILSPEEIALLQWQVGDRLRALGYEIVDAGERMPSVADRLTARLSRAALEWKHRLNIRTPLGRVAQKPLEIGLS